MRNQLYVATGLAGALFVAMIYPAWVGIAVLLVMITWELADRWEDAR